jgi:hypothetical protein
MTKPLTDTQRAILRAAAARPHGLAAPTPRLPPGRGPGGEVVRTFITTDANEKLRALHDRMPVILPRDTWAAWLGEKPAEPEELLALLIPYPSSELAAWPVPRRVGRVAEDDPGFAERDPTASAVAGLDDLPPAALRPA